MLKNNSGNQSKRLWEAPEVERPTFESLSDEEAAEIRGGKWRAGTCVGVGYGCSNSGGIHLGVCVIVGYTS
jgi:hypothetical protein